MNKLGLTSLFLFIIFSTINAQTFPNDRAKFSKQLLTVTAQSATAKDQDFIKNTLSPFLLSEANMSNEIFDKMVVSCNLMDGKRLSFYPEIYQYVYTIYSLSKNNVSKQNYDNWHAILSTYFEGKSMTKAKEFLTFSYDFFGGNTLSSRSNFAWKYIGGTFTFRADKEPTIDLKDGKLVCYLDNKGKGANYQLIDSIVVSKTAGVFYPMKDVFDGKNGVITWEKVGLDPTKVFAELLTPYSVNTKLAKLSVDTVSMTTPAFQTKVKGVLSDVAYSINRETDRNNPQFRSFEKSLRIKDFSPGIDYIGGFKYEGADFVGSGVGNTPAKLIIYNDKKKVFAEVFADLVINSDKKIVAENARAVIHLGDKDSITHPDVLFNYFKDTKLFEFTRVGDGLGASPFISNYHKLDMYVPKITWEKDATFITMTYGKEIAEELKMATFESTDYFSKEQYQAIQSIASVHPLVAIYNYCYKYDDFELTEAKFAASLNRTFDQCRELIVILSRDGYIIRDTKNKKIIVTDKVKKIIEREKGKEDYDYIIFRSDLRQARMPAQYTAEEINRTPQLQQLDSLIKDRNSKRRVIANFGTLDLTTYALSLNAIEKVDLSEVKFTFVIPDNDQIVVGKNRDFEFKGWLRSGKIEIKVENGRYDYAKNAVNLIKTQNMLLAVKPQKKEDGQKLIFLNSFISNAQGELYVDDPTNRSGVKKSITKFPILDIKNSARVYYSHNSIQRGAYDTTRFYFALKPFVIDSLVNFSDDNLRFGGELISAGIFPKFSEELKIMPDYSLGFIKQAPQGGYTFYETNAKYENKVMLTNSGLQGSGKIEFIKSITESAQFTFLPDSTIGVAKFTNLPSESGVEFPDIVGSKTNIAYNPKKQYLNVYSLEDPILMFKDIQYVGQLVVRADGIIGNGIVIMPDANLKSRVYKFNRWHAKANSADFNLVNKYAEEGEGGLSFVTDDVNADLDFKARKGVFKTNKGETKTQFPLNNFYCMMDKYTWFMDDQNIMLEKTNNNQSNDLDISAGLGLATPNFFSTNAKQDSLRFKVPKAVFSLKQKTIFCEQIDFVDIADARIFPNEGKLNILKKGVIEPLENSKITANYVTKYHTFEQASTNILARRKYEAIGKYPYKDADDKVTYIDMTKIYVDTGYQTVAIGEIKADENFKLSQKFDYYGKIKIIAANPTITFDGATRINHNCNEFARSWMAFVAPIDPKNIQIPVSKNMKTLEGEAVTAGLVWRDARSPDSVKIYPAFLSKLQDPNDNEIIRVEGILQYNPSSKEFQIASAEKLQNRGEKGNYLSLHTETCSLNGDGKIDLGMNYGDVEVINYGIVNYDNKTRITTMNLTSQFLFPKLDKSSFEKIGNKIIANEGLLPLDLNTSTLEQAILEIKDKKAADAVKNEFVQKGVVKNLPKEMEEGITITGIQLKSFYDGLNNGLITSVSSASIVSILGKSVFKQVPFRAYFKQTYSGNVTGDKLQFEIDIPGGGMYFFDYGMEKKNGTLQIYTTDEELKRGVNELKDDKKKYKNFSYGITENSGIMNNFMRILK